MDPPPIKGPQHDVQGNMGPRLVPGTFLGYSRDSNSYRVGLADGSVAESRAVQRVPFEERWDHDKLEGITATPWTMRDRAKTVRMELGEHVDKHLPPEPDAPPLPRRLKITVQTLKLYGPSTGCKQCEHFKAFGETKNGLAHSEACRKRIVEAMSATEHGAARVRDTDERIDRAISERVRAHHEGQASHGADQVGITPGASSSTHAPCGL